MKRHWGEQELAERWSLTHDEFELLQHRTERSRLGFAVLLKFFQGQGRFPTERKEVPAVVLDYVAAQVDISRDVFAEYDLTGRSCERDRAQIRARLGFRRVSVDDAQALAHWLAREVLSVDHQVAHVREAALEWCRSKRIEPPTSSRLDRIVRSALRAYEHEFYAVTYEKTRGCRAATDALLRPDGDRDHETGPDATPFAELRADPGPVSLKSVLKEIAKLRRIAAVGVHQ